MMPDGQFREVSPRLGWPARVFLMALGVSFVAGIVASVALLIYVALLLLPVALALAAYGYFSIRLQAWRANRS
jgi:TctA family transporter